MEPPLNRPPDARDDFADVVNGGSVTTAVLFNDTDPDGDQLAVTITSGPDASLGSASVTPNRSIAFTATPGASGTAVVNYQVSDGELTDTAALRITVRPCSESTPVANDGFLATGYEQPIAVDLAAFGSGGAIVDVAGAGRIRRRGLHAAGRRERQRVDQLFRGQQLPAPGNRTCDHRCQSGPHGASADRQRLPRRPGRSFR